MRQIQEPRLTFDVDDPHGHHRYTLRQSRYDAVADDINDWARAAKLGHRDRSKGRTSERARAVRGICNRTPCSLVRAASRSAQAQWSHSSILISPPERAMTPGVSSDDR